jgi:hypothetical protein
MRASIISPIIDIWKREGITHIPHSNSSYHSSLGTILSISSNVLITLGGLALTVPVRVDCDCVWDIADFGGPVLVRVLPPGDGGGLFVNLTRGDVGDVGDVTVSSILIHTDENRG